MAPDRLVIDASRSVLDGPDLRRTAGLRRSFAAMLLPAALLLLVGCSNMQQARLRWTPANPLEQVLQLSAWSGAQPSSTTLQVLRRYALEEKARTDPAAAVAPLKEIYGLEPQPLLCYALAELNYVAASRSERADRNKALEHYWACVALSYEYLFDTPGGGSSNPFDPHFRRACDLYNGGLEKCLRIAVAMDGFKPGKRLSVMTRGGQVELSVVSRSSQWGPEDFERFEFCNDYEVLGLKNHYRNYGLGVSLIGIRRDGPKDDPRERHYARQLAFPLTAFLRLPPPQQVEAAAGACRAELELYDPLELLETEVCNRRIPLECDLTTPLARFLSNRDFESLTTQGLLRPEEVMPQAGLYMVQPHQPGKVPVVMVHGFWSNPMTWMEMFNDLRSVPEIRSRYQFWFFMYPTGLPFWKSSHILRRELARVREEFDPQGQDPAFDRMVLVGHSMGGLISRMQTIDGGEPFWNIFTDKPFDELKSRPELKQAIYETVFFRANPSVSRVVSIASPHRGSQFANSLTQFVGRSLITLPSQITEGPAELIRDNPGYFRDPAQVTRVHTAIDSLSTQSPILPVILSAPKPPWVTYHNVVGRVDRNPPETSSDGVVSFTSAHLDEAVSELIVDVEHRYAPQHPLTILEVQRILREHAGLQGGNVPLPAFPASAEYCPILGNPFGSKAGAEAKEGLNLKLPQLPQLPQLMPIVDVPAGPPMPSMRRSDGPIRPALK